MDKDNPSGIYLLPNLLTTASLFAAFYSLVSSVKGYYEAAIVAMFIGMIADSLDGRIARLTNTQTEFGAEYDSLSDMVTFGVAPSLLLYQLTLSHLGKFGWLVAFVYTAAVALRLARFNVQHIVADKRYFTGLPCPPSAAVMSAFAWICFQHDWHNYALVSYLTAILALCSAALMVSNIRYYSFKEVDFKGKVNSLYVLGIILTFVAIAADPAMVLFLVAAVYAFYAPMMACMRVRRIRKGLSKPKEQ